jgi:sucrose-6-phosphate hydrolase SacC (GH32 family)
MKKQLLLLLACCQLITAFAQKNTVYLFSYFKGNSEDGLHLAYSEDAFTWHTLKNDSSFLKPTAGKDKLMRDPCIIRGRDGNFHMVWTVSWNEKGIGYASSKDLINWSEQQYLPVMEQEDSARNCWAPEIFYDKAENQYMIYWATTIPGRFANGDTSGDSRYNHRMYYCTTKDFKNFSATKLLYDHGFNVIDATIQKEDRQYIMFLKDETRYPPQKNIRIATSNTLTGGYTQPSAPITGKYWAEGPTILRLNGQWVVYFDKYTEHKYGAVVSPDLKSWTDISDQVEMPKGMRHGSIIPITVRELERIKGITKK